MQLKSLLLLGRAPFHSECVLGNSRFKDLRTQYTSVRENTELFPGEYLELDLGVFYTVFKATDGFGFFGG